MSSCLSGYGGATVCSLGVLTYPFSRGTLEHAGVKSRKIHDCYPVMNYKRFFDTASNGKEIMNIGAAIPKKSMGDYMALSNLLPNRTFNLYALGYKVSSLAEANEKMGGNVNFIAPIDPENMLPHYKRHEWLVYTASRKFNTVGGRWQWLRRRLPVLVCVCRISGQI